MDGLSITSNIDKKASRLTQTSKVTNTTSQMSARKSASVIGEESDVKGLQKEVSRDVNLSTAGKTWSSGASDKTEISLRKKDETTDFESKESIEIVEEERETWTKHIEFVLSCLGYAVGLGNVWRFPYLVYKNGGGAFLIPYFLMLSCVGMPIFFIEVCLGQFTSKGPSMCWKFATLFKGIGFGMCWVSFLIAIYYNIILVWSFTYIYKSMADVLPWKRCRFDITDIDNKYCRILKTFCENMEDLEEEDCQFCYFEGDRHEMCQDVITLDHPNRTRLTPQLALLSMKKEDTRLSGDLYFDNEILGIGLKKHEGFWDLGELRLEPLLGLVAIWTLAAFCTIKGIKSVGKVAYVATLAPYFFLTLLFFNVIWRDGATEGIKFYVTPDFDKLKNADIWSEAASQIFFSLSAAMGGLIALSSYTKFNNNILQDTIFVVIGNSMTSIFAGFVVFSYVGYMAHQLDVQVDQFAKSGPSLVFKVYPMALSLIPGAQFWSVLFFLMLISLGINSEIVFIETLATCIRDNFPRVRKAKAMLATALCIILFMLGIPMVFNGGLLLLDVFDTYSGGWNLILIALCEMIAIGWVYGYKRFLKDIECMIGKKKSPLWIPWRFWRYYFIGTWCVIGPTFCMAMIIGKFVDLKPAAHWAIDFLGWMLTMFSVSSIFGTMVYLFTITKGSCKERLQILTTPLPDWGPAKKCHRELVAEYVPDFKVILTAPPTPRSPASKQSEDLSHCSDCSDVYKNLDDVEISDLF